MSTDPAALEHEEQIAWTEDVGCFDYVRQMVARLSTTRRKPVGWHGVGRRVILRAQVGCSQRRYGQVRPPGVLGEGL